MKDRFGRVIDYLRVSMTDHCNFRCMYCMPEEGAPCSPKDEVLTTNELKLILEASIHCEFVKFRLTGGEPLLSKSLEDVASFLKSHSQVQEISLTTNGYLLADRAESIKKAGIDRVNISLDSLDPDRFARIARRGEFKRVWQGIETAIESGLAPVKLNCVVMRGVNDDEVAEFARLTIDRPIHVRFIELMPISWNLDGVEFHDPLVEAGHGLIALTANKKGMLDATEMRRMVVHTKETKLRIEEEFGSLSTADVVTNGPARNFRIPDALGTIGFISQISQDLCSRCNRMRLTTDGCLRPCLMSDGEMNLREIIRNGGSVLDVENAFRQVLAVKPERHYLAEGQVPVGRTMSQIGG